jgi:hypothetical protein
MDALVFVLIADDMFVIIALPNFANERRPTQLFDAVDIFISGHRFEPLDDGW